MTASRRGLAILTAIALVLGLVVALDRPRAAAPTQRRLFPDFDPEAVPELVVGSIAVKRVGDRWVVDGPRGGPAAPDVVADILGALELASAARWMSTADGDRSFGEPRTAITFGEGNALAIGNDAGGGLVWATIGEGKAVRYALVESWVARALDRDLADLRDPAVVHNAAPTGIELHAGGVDFVGSGIPLRANVAGGVFRVAPARAAELVDSLLALRFTAFPRDPPGASQGSLRVLGATPDEIDDLGLCPGDAAARLLGGSSGSGCVDGAAWTAVLDAARAITPDALDPAPLAATSVARIELPDGSTLTARGGDWTLVTPDGDREPDVPAIRDFLAALAAPGRLVAAVPTTSHPLRITYADGATDSFAISATALTRRGEPRGIEVSAALLRTLDRGYRAFIDRTVLALERTRVRGLGVGDTGAGSYRLEMGATFEDWTARGRTTVDADALDSLLDLVESLIADEIIPEPRRRGPRARILELDVAAAPTTGAQPTSHHLDIDRPGADGRCHARVDRTDAILAVEDCAILLAPLAD